MIEDIVYNQWSIILGLLYTGWLTAKIVKRTTNGRKEKAGCLDVIRVFLIMGGLFFLTILGAVAFGSAFIRNLSLVLSGQLYVDMILVAKFITYGTMTAVLVFTFIGVMIYGMGWDMKRYNQLARMLGLGIVVPIVMLMFNGALIYALCINLDKITLSVLLIFFILIMTAGTLMYVKIMIDDRIFSLESTESKSNKGNKGNKRSKSNDKGERTRQTANQSMQMSDKTTHEVNSNKGPKNVEWTRRSNRRKKR